MLYERSLGIERRLQAVLTLVKQGGYSTPMIAEKLGVSVPTVSRDVTALRQRGFEILAEKGSNGWRYVLRESRTPRRRGRNGRAAEASA